MLLTLMSCTYKQLDPKLIIGSWKLIDVKNNRGLNVTHKVTFYKNDSLYEDIFVDNKLDSQIKGKYELNTENKTLTTTIIKNISFRFEVIKLTETELEVKEIKTNKLTRYIRF